MLCRKKSVEKGDHGREPCVFPRMSGGRGKGEQGEEAQMPSTALQSLFSTLALYLVSNTSPGKRKHFSGQSWGNIIPPSCDLYGRWEAVGGCLYAAQEYVGGSSSCRRSGGPGVCGAHGLAGSLP